MIRSKRLACAANGSRNQLHFVDPGTGKIGYFLISLPTSQSGFPEP